MPLSDDVDGELVVEVLGEVQWDLEGFHALTYTAKDSAGNQAIPVRVIMITSSAIEEETPESNLECPAGPK